MSTSFANTHNGMCQVLFLPSFKDNRRESRLLKYLRVLQHRFKHNLKPKHCEKNEKKQSKINPLNFRQGMMPKPIRSQRLNNRLYCSYQFQCAQELRGQPQCCAINGLTGHELEFLS